jgi:predicted transcriptional regulator
MAQILKETNTAVNKTRIMYKCNLNYSQLQKYLKMMLEMKLLVRKIDNDCREKFLATSKGNFFVKKFHLLQVQMT